MLINESCTDHICTAGFPLITGSPDERVMGLWDREPHKLCRVRERWKTKKEVDVWPRQAAGECRRDRVSETINHILCWSAMSRKATALLSANKPNNKIRAEVLCPSGAIHHATKLIHGSETDSSLCAAGRYDTWVFFSMSACVFLNHLKPHDGHPQPGRFGWGTTQIGGGISG